MIVRSRWAITRFSGTPPRSPRGPAVDKTHTERNIRIVPAHLWWPAPRREDLPVQNRVRRYGAATVLALVALRLVTGWHFFTEGTQHLADPHWSSEGFLRAAKGPLAAHYQGVLPEAGFGFDDTLHVATTSSKDAGEVIDAWRDRVLEGLKAAEQRFAGIHKPTDDQKADDAKNSRAPANAISRLAGRHTRRSGRPRSRVAAIGLGEKISLGQRRAVRKETDRRSASQAERPGRTLDDAGPLDRARHARRARRPVDPRAARRPVWPLRPARRWKRSIARWPTRSRWSGLA